MHIRRASATPWEQKPSFLSLEAWEFVVDCQAGLDEDRIRNQGVDAVAEAVAVEQRKEARDGGTAESTSTCSTHFHCSDLQRHERLGTEKRHVDLRNAAQPRC